MDNLSKRLVEVSEVLSYLNSNEYNKIPKEIINSINENKDKVYTWKYDENKKLKDQNLHRDTIAILSYLNMTYLLNEEQRELIRKLHDLNEKKLIIKIILNIVEKICLRIIKVQMKKF